MRTGVYDEGSDKIVSFGYSSSSYSSSLPSDRISCKVDVFQHELVLLSSSSRRWAFNYLKAQLHITLSDALLDQETTLATLTGDRLD